MRSLLFKNLTSTDRRRKILSTSEVSDKEGVRSIIQRHFVYMVKEIKNDTVKPEKTPPYLYILKERNHKEQREKFFCRIKGKAYAVSKGKLFVILFMHSLKIVLQAVPNDLATY